VRVVADLLPKEANINVEVGEAFVELWRRISDGLGDNLAETAWMRSKNRPLLFVTRPLMARPTASATRRAKTEFMKDPKGNLAKAQSYYSSKHPG
jgi:hypothetical protein